MTRTEELLALAEASIQERPARNRLYKMQDAANPETIKQLVELVRLQHAALEFASDFIPASECKVGECEVCEAIAAFDAWQKGGE